MKPKTESNLRIVKLFDEDGYQFKKIAEILTKEGRPISSKNVGKIYYREKAKMSLQR